MRIITKPNSIISELHDSQGLVRGLHGIRLTGMSSDGVGDYAIEYEVIGGGAQEILDWMAENFPEFRMVDPKREAFDAYTQFIKSVEENAVARYKRENGITS